MQRHESVGHCFDAMNQLRLVELEALDVVFALNLYVTQHQDLAPEDRWGVGVVGYQAGHKRLHPDLDHVSKRGRIDRCLKCLDFGLVGWGGPR